MSQAVYDYKHEKYVAGHSDVFKHVTFCACISELQKVHPEGILLVDVHCGDGVYDLNDCAAKGSLEYQKGIYRVLAKYEELIAGESTTPIPAVIQEYIQLLFNSTGCTSKNDLDVYPGSPVFGQNLLRDDCDEHRLLDYYLDTVEWLKDTSTFQQLNAYEPSTLEYILPSNNTKHPIIFLDPPYETIDDYSQTKLLAEKILDINPYATIIIWIPYVTNHRNRWLYPKGMRDMAKVKAKTGRYFCSMNVNKNNLQGSGILICNPTSDFDDIMNDEAVHWLANTMHQGKDEYLVEQTMKKKKSTT